MVAVRTARVRKEEPQKFFGYCDPNILPVKVDELVIIPAGIVLTQTDGTKLRNPKEVEVKVAKITLGKSYKDWNRDGTKYNHVHVSNPQIGFKTSIGMLFVDINDVKWKAKA